MWHQLEIRSAEGVAVACGEVREGHLVGTTDFRVDMVNLAGKAVRRKPLGHCVWIEECAIDFLRRRTEHAVKPNGAGGHDHFSFQCFVMPELQGRSSRLESTRALVASVGGASPSSV